MLSDIYSSNSNFLKAEDLQDKKPVLTISGAEVVEKDYGDGPKKQIILSFDQTPKVLGLNYTNAAKIAELTGTEEFEEWVGTSIKLYKDTTKTSGGKTVPCIRIFPELPDQKAVAASASAPAMTGPPTDDDESQIPF